MKLDMSQELYVYNYAGILCQLIRPLTMTNKFKKSFWSYVKQNIKLGISSNPTFDSSLCTQFFSTFFRLVNPSKSFDIPSWIPAIEEPLVPYDISPPSYHQITKTIGRMKASSSPCPLDNISIVPSNDALFFVHILQWYFTLFGFQGKSRLTGKRLVRSLHIKRVILQLLPMSGL